MRQTGILALICWTIFVACSPYGYTSMIYGNNYDERKDQTMITMLPYGGVTLPGKWVETHYNNVSRQHFFRNADSVEFAVALNPWNQFEFYKKEMTEAGFVKAFYEWESVYFQQQTGCEVRVVREDNDKNIILWNIRKDRTINSYYLFGLRNKIAYNLSITTQKWDEETIAGFLEKAYFEQ